MKNLNVIRERYLRDKLPIRLGGLAANLSRIKSFAANEANREAVLGLIEESKFFIEWTAAEAEIEKAAELIALQVELARWQRNWENIWSDTEQRQQVAEQSRRWSEKVLEISGLFE
ncbi:MAG: hypothetical protein ONB37_02655 [candidate division KSB1 bacterium]|nr:hypothetical protein [candidate division KSB1 bacterium]